MPANKLRNQQRSATVALKIRKTKAETLKRSKTSWVNDIFSDDINRQLAGISQVRKLIDMSKTKHGPGSRLSNLVDIKLSILDREPSAFVPRFIKFLSNNDSWQLQVEAAWLITELYGLYHGNWMIPSLVEPIFQKLYTNQESLEVVVAGILSNHTLLQSIAAKQFRTLLSINKTLHLCKATKFSVIHRFAQFIKMTSVPQQLRDDSAWILVLIFSPNLAQIFDMDEYELVVEAVVKLLDFPDKSLCEKALLVVWKIAAGDCDCLLSCGALTPLLNKLKEANNNLPMQREVTRILSMIFESKPDLEVTSEVTSAVHLLLELLRSDDVDVLTNVCCALSYCFAGIHPIVKHQNSFDLIFGQLIGLLRHESCSVTIPVLKIVVRTKERSLYCKFDLADLDCLVTLLDNHSEDKHVVNYICSIMCGVVECGNMEAVITAGFMKKLVNLIQTVKVGMSDRDREAINYTAVATINFAIARGNDAQIKYLVDISCIEVLCDFIASCWSDHFVKGTCESLEKILQLGVIDYASRIEKKVKSIHCCSYYRWYFDEFLLKLDKRLGRSHRRSQGLSEETLISEAKLLQLDTHTCSKVSAVTEFFQNHGFSATQVKKIIRLRPKLLASGVDETLKPKWLFLQSIGFSEDECRKIIWRSPTMLHSSIRKLLTPSFDSLKTFMGSKVKAMAAIKRSPQILNIKISHSLKQTIQVLHQIGIPDSQVSEFILKSPVILTINPQKMSEVGLRLKEMGFDVTSAAFRTAFTGMSIIRHSKLERKLETYRSVGFSDVEILNIFRSQPTCMFYSEENIRAIVTFYVDRLHFSPSHLSQRPGFLLCSVERRLIPRCSVMQVLWSRGIISVGKLSSILMIREKDFLEKYVTKYEAEVPELLAAYRGELKFKEYSFHLHEIRQISTLRGSSSKTKVA